MQIVASRKGQNYMQHAQRRCLFRLGYGAAPTPPGTKCVKRHRQKLQSEEKEMSGWGECGSGVHFSQWSFFLRRDKVIAVGEDSAGGGGCV